MFLDLKYFEQLGRLYSNQFFSFLEKQKFGGYEKLDFYFHENEKYVVHNQTSEQMLNLSLIVQKHCHIARNHCHVNLVIT